MNLIRTIKSLIPKPLKLFLKKFLKKNKLADAISPYLSEVICIDVGASYFPHTKWHLFLSSPKTYWVAVDPIEKNLAYTKSWPYPSKVQAIATGLSHDGGPKTLYVTNVDSGSSLLEPVITDSMKHRMKARQLDYFFPVTKSQVQTKTLDDIIQQAASDQPVFIKLDTQGTELSILSGAERFLKEKRVVGVEMESTLLAQPTMNGSGKFWEACKYLEDLGFELIDFDPVVSPSNLNINNPRGKRYLSECDAIFVLRFDIAQTLPLNYRMGLFAFYLSYHLYEEAITLIEEDAEVKAHFKSQGVDTGTLLELLTNYA